MKQEDVSLPQGLNEVAAILADVMQGDNDAAKRPEYANLNFNAILKALNWLNSTDMISGTTRLSLAKEPWRLSFKRCPPTMEEFLTPYYIGPQAESMYAPVKHALIEFWNPLEPYRTFILIAHIGWGKSLALQISYLFCSTHFGLMRSPWAFFGQSPATIYTSCMCGATIKKATELLIDPFRNILEQAPYFKKERTRNDMKKAEQEFLENDVIDHLSWTTAVDASALSFAGGNNYKLISSEGGLLGQTVLIGGATEIGFWREQPGWNDEKIQRFVSKIRGRITSRMKGNYYGRFVIDSSPSTMEDPMMQFAFVEAPQSKLNYLVAGSRWHYYPEDFRNFMKPVDPQQPQQTPRSYLNNYEELQDFKVGFPLYKGGNGQVPSVIDNEGLLQNYDPVDIVWQPRETITASGIESYLDHAKENPIEFIKDYCGIPSNAADRIFYVPQIIENCFDNQLKSVFGSITAPSLDDPEHLIWNKIAPIFFYKVFDEYRYYYHPEQPRCLSVDQQYAQDLAAISVSHVCFNKKRLDSQTKQPTLEYVTDFVIYLNPKGGLVNLDAIKFFAMDLRNLGRLNIKHISFDGFQSKPTQQFLQRAGFTVDYVSVDRDNKPYLTYINLVNDGRWHCGKNIFLKNNMKSLVMAKRRSGSTKVEHVDGDLIYDWTMDWDKCLAGIYAKDGTDAVAGNMALLEQYANDFPPVVEWDPELTAGRTTESVKKNVTDRLARMGLAR